MFVEGNFFSTFTGDAGGTTPEIITKPLANVPRPAQCNNARRRRSRKQARPNALRAYISAHELSERDSRGCSYNHP